MSFLQEQFGERISTLQLAVFLGVDVKTVRKYYYLFNGVRLGRKIVFFEKEVKRALQARKQMACPGEKEWKMETQNVSNKTKSFRMGGGSKERIEELKAERDPLGLLD